MDIIEVKVMGNYVTKDNKNAGTQGEANAKALRIEFDEGWDGCAKAINWWDAKGNFAKSRVLTADLLEDLTASTRIYLTTIPGEAMLEWGQCMFGIDGYINGKRKRSVYAKLVVKPGDGNIVLEEVTPSQIEQLQVQIDTLLADMQAEAIRAEKAKEAAETAQKGAETAKADAEKAKNDAETAKTGAENAQNIAKSYTNNPPVPGENGNWQVWDGTKYVDTGKRYQGDPLTYEDLTDEQIKELQLGLGEAATNKDIIPEQYLTFKYNILFANGAEDGLIAGDTYIIDWKGVRYEAICYDSGANDENYIGNYQLIDPSAEGSNYPFCILAEQDSSSYTVTKETSAAETVKIRVQHKGHLLANSIFVPDGAKVGQIIQVTKVNGAGKPTEWKAVDMPSGGEISKILWTARGQMRKQVRDFQGWAHCVQYDPELGLAVGIINSGNGSHTNAQPWYRTTIDPKTGYMSDYEEITVLDTDGETVITPEAGYMGSFRILSDGTYMCIDGKQTIYTSPDKGKTLVKKLQYAFSTMSDASMFGLTELSTGRLLVGHGGQKNTLWYSDDDGTTWTSVVPSVANLGAQVYPEGNHTPFEPCFIECGGGKVICYARASMGAYNTYAEGAYSKQEAAVYSVSKDYGATWSAWNWSKTILDMTGNNAKAVVVNGKAHMVFGSRYHGFTDAYGNTPHFALRYATATLEDAFADNWSDYQVIDIGHWNLETAEYTSDCGYPSVFAVNGNLYAIYYDSDGTGSAYGANWRLVLGSGVAQVQPASNGKGAMNVGYTQAAVDAIVSKLTTKINDLYLKIGEMPPDAEKGELPITDGLVEWFNPADESAWDDTYLLSSKLNTGKTATGVSGGGTWLYTNYRVKPTVFNDGLAQIGLVMPAMSEYGITGECSIEFTFDIGTNQNIFFLCTAPANWGTNNTSVFSLLNNPGGVYETNVCHLIMVFTTDGVLLYKNGQYVETKTAVAETDIAASFALVRPYGYGLGEVRLYNRALTADEVKNNYTYASKQTTIGADYFTA